MKKLLAITVLLLSCVDVPETSVDESEVVIPPHTGAGSVTCWRSNAPNTVCTSGQICRYSSSYGNVGACVAPQPLDTASSWTTVDGPEDCAAGLNACFRGPMYAWGERYVTSCQVEACPVSDETSSNGTLCNPSLAATGCPAGQTCVRAGAQASPPSYPWDLNHSGLQRYMWLCR